MHVAFAECVISAGSGSNEGYVCLDSQNILIQFSVTTINSYVIMSNGCEDKNPLL